ncbi:MAG: copper-translocating P-type ATPase [Candidatus Omnitrophota bacterium]
MTEKVKDPVCGMTVDKHNAVRTEKDGRVYFFCGDNCRDKFLSGARRKKGGHVHSAGGGHNHCAHHAGMIADFKKRFWISLIITLPILILSPLIQSFLGLREVFQFNGDLYVLFALSSVVFFYGGRPFLKGLFDETRKKEPGMMTLIGIAITIAYVYSAAVVFGLKGKVFFWEIVTLVDIMLVGHWIEMKSIMGASRALEELAKLMPRNAHKLMSDGSVKDVVLEELTVNDKVIIKPGEKIPADGEVVEGESSVDEAMLTGESNPISKKAGEQVIGGSINGEGSLTVKVKKTGKDSFLFQIIGFVKEAQESKSRSQELASRAALWLTIIAITCGIATLLVWLVFARKDFAFALERTVTVMVITCPHALGLAVPLVTAVSTALAAGSGLLIRNRAAFERARNIQVIIFDKTGTLTLGKFGITDKIIFSEDITEEDLIKYAASVEARSEHPIAKGIASAVKDFFPVEKFKAITGKGVEAKVNGRDVKVVSAGYLKENGMGIKDERLEKISSQGKTIVFVIIDGEVKGAIAAADIIRPESKEAVDRLRNMGIKCMMLTGDNKEVARWVANEIGLDEYFAEVLPKEKAQRVKEIQRRGLIVAMAGDGINDAPAIAQADVGIAIGVGTDVAIETADIILVKNNPLDAVAIIGLAQATYKKMVQNLAWATGYNIFAIPLAAGVFYKAGILLSPAAGALLMSLSTVIVAVNARFLKIKK